MILVVRLIGGGAGRALNCELDDFAAGIGRDESSGMKGGRGRGVLGTGGGTSLTETEILSSLVGRASSPLRAASTAGVNQREEGGILYKE